MCIRDRDTYYLHGGTDEEFDDYMDSIFDYYNEIGFDITVDVYKRQLNKLCICKSILLFKVFLPSIIVILLSYIKYNK